MVKENGYSYDIVVSKCVIYFFIVLLRRLYGEVVIEKPVHNIAVSSPKLPHKRADDFYKRPREYGSEMNTNSEVAFPLSGSQSAKWGRSGIIRGS